MSRTYRSRALRAQHVREHLADAVIGILIGVILTPLLYLATLAVVAELSP